MPLVRVSDEVHGRLKEEAEKRGVTMSGLIGELSVDVGEPHEDVVDAMREDGELEGLSSAWDRNLTTTISVNAFTSRLFEILVSSVGSRGVKDKKTYLEWLAVKEYKKWCGD